MVEYRQTVPFPALAGMNREALHWWRALLAVPRARGDEPFLTL